MKYLTDGTYKFHVHYQVRITEKDSNIMKATKGIFTKGNF